MSNLEEGLNKCVEIARETMKKDGNLQATWSLNMSDGNYIILTTPFTSDEQKDEWVRIVRTLCLVYNVVEYHFMGEAWLTTFEIRTGESEEEAAERFQRGDVGDAEQVEVVNFVSCNDDNKIVAWYDIKRNNEGWPTDIVERDRNYGDVDAGQGKFQNILPPALLREQFPDDIRERMKELFKATGAFHFCRFSWDSTQ